MAASRKVDESLVKHVRDEVERLVKAHGHTVVRRAFNKYLGALHEKEKLAERKREIEAEMAALDKKLRG
jgi:hypothetical protein